MGNELNELNGEVLEDGRDVFVINKQLPITVGIESILLQVCIWIVPMIIAVVCYPLLKVELDSVVAILVCFLIAFLPGIIFALCRISASNYLLQIQQKLQHDASQIDNYLEQRVVILKNAAKLLEKSINFDKETFTDIAKLRSGNNLSDADRNDLAESIDKASNSINVAFENYPDLKAHNEIENVMQQNSYLQKEITAAREVYNDTVLIWNKEIYEWPIKKIVAASKHYTTRIPFATSTKTKQEATEVLF